MPDLPRTEQEIETVLDAAIAVTSTGQTRWRGMTYEEGIRNALQWVLGESDDDPMED